MCLAYSLTVSILDLWPAVSRRHVCILQDGVKPIDIEGTTAAQFAIADADGDGRVNFSDFLAYYGKLTTSQARRELRRAFGPQAESRPSLRCIPLHVLQLCAHVTSP